MAWNSGGAPRIPATDAMLMIFPFRWPIITFPDACENRNVPVKFVSSTLFQCSSRISSTGAPQAIPALLINTSMRPNSATVASTASFTLAGSFTSQLSAIAFTPRLRNSAAAASHRSFFRAHSTTFAPISAKPCVICRPSPMEPPVTIATRPLRSQSLLVCIQYPVIRHTGSHSLSFTEALTPTQSEKSDARHSAGVALQSTTVTPHLVLQEKRKRAAVTRAFGAQRSQRVEWARVGTRQELHECRRVIL